MAEYDDVDREEALRLLAERYGVSPPARPPGPPAAPQTPRQRELAAAAERQKRLLDYDYYRRKVTELQARKEGVKDMNKITRNAEKLSSSEASYLNVKNELLARMNALLTERNDFANSPLPRGGL